MTKHIRPEQFDPDMDIHGRDCGWLDHPFVSTAFLADDQAGVAKIVDLARVPDCIARF